MPKAPQLVTACCVGALGLLTSVGDLRAYCRTMTCTDACSILADGCPGGGVPISWPGRCTSYSVAAGSTSMRFRELSDVTDKAFETWRNVICPDGNPPSIVSVDAFGPTFCQHHEYNSGQPNANAIIFLEGPWPHEDSTSALALTSVTFDTNTGVIFDADIEINGSGTFPISATDVVPPGSYDLQAIVTHEAGHFLGLAHSNMATATMWTQTETGSDAFRRLTRDDVDAICEAYPSRRTAVCDYTPRQGFSAQCRMQVTRAGACSTASPPPGSVDSLAKAGMWTSTLIGSTLLLVLRRRRLARRRQGRGIEVR
jgi:hypothetical protein